LPLYEYQCRSCGREFQYLVLKKEDEVNIQCPGCKGADVKKLVSRVAYHVSEQDRLSAFRPDTPKDDAFYKDTRNIGLQAKKRAQQMGVDLGAGFETKLDKLRTDPGKVFDESE
jgi:putative FmdB family regulatory protein